MLSIDRNGLIIRTEIVGNPLTAILHPYMRPWIQVTEVYDPRIKIIFNKSRTGGEKKATSIHEAIIDIIKSFVPRTLIYKQMVEDLPVKLLAKITPFGNCDHGYQSGITSQIFQLEPEIRPQKTIQSR